MRTLEGGLPAERVISKIAAVGALLAPFNDDLFWRYCHHVSKRIAPQRYACVLDIAPDTQMRVSLDDPYWSRLVARSYTYERDFEHILTLFRDLNYTFLDCGANCGYWSLLVSGEKLGCHPTLAIEASPQTFSILRDNCALNDNRFAIINQAIFHTSGLSAHMVGDDSGHEAARIDLSASAPNTIQTITIDDALIAQFGRIPEAVVVKLDVEGEEINALKGAPKAIAQGGAIYYEDHASDPSCQVTQFTLDVLELDVFFSTDQGNVRRIRTAGEAASVKHQKSRGYNFLACQSSSPFYRRLVELTD